MVVLALVLACLTVVASTAYLIRPAMTADETAPAAGGGTTACQEARLESFRASFDAAAEHSPVVEGLGGQPGQALDLDVGTANLSVGPYASLVAFDLGDGQVTPAGVGAAVAEVLALRGGELPDLPVGRVTASGYVAHESDGQREGGVCDVPVLCPVDDAPYVNAHPDHVATHEAARALVASEVAEGAWLVWRAGDLPLQSEQVLFPRVQSFEVVRR